MKKIWVLLAIAFAYLIYTPPKNVRYDHIAQQDLDFHRRKAYEYAKDCLGLQETRALNSVVWSVVAGEKFYIGKDSLDVPMYAVGLYRSDTIFIAEPYNIHVQAMAHEWIHAMGISGHPDDIFTRCYLSKDQIIRP